MQEANFPWQEKSMNILPLKLRQKLNHESLKAKYTQLLRKLELINDKVFQINITLTQKLPQYEVFFYFRKKN